MEDNMVATNQNRCCDRRKDIRHELHIDFIMQVRIHIIPEEQPLLHFLTYGLALENRRVIVLTTCSLLSQSDSSKIG